MALHPPATERELHNEEQHANQKTGRDAQLAVKSKSPVVEQHGTDNALRNVVGQAHTSIGSELQQQATQIGAIIGHEDARYQDEHEGKLGKRRDDEQRLHNRMVLYPL